jgi:hypothetical protein
VDLYAIPIEDIAVILGIEDWLSNHGAHIKYGEEMVSIRNFDGGRIVYQGDKYTQIEVDF